MLTFFLDFIQNDLALCLYPRSFPQQIAEYRSKQRLTRVSSPARNTEVS